jgi:colanic acid/amylovoran biosynthesis glycosyltransferase
MSSAPRIRVAYLINQYPKLSHTFIRREILALE